MSISTCISPGRVLCRTQATSKKRALELLSELIARAEPGLLPTEVFDSLVARERLGSTGVGHGVAIPHGRLKNIKQPIGAFVQLVKGVDFDAPDGKPVELLFALAVPEGSTEEHLRLLAALAELFSDEPLRQRLRRASTASELCVLLNSAPDEISPGMPPAA